MALNAVSSNVLSYFMYATTPTCAYALNIKTVYAFSDNVFAATDSSYILNERKIMTDLLRDYETAVRPVMQDSDAVPVRFDMTIISVESLVSACTRRQYFNIS